MIKGPGLEYLNKAGDKLINFKDLFNNHINMMSTEDILLNEIEEFNSSDKRSWMITGDKYYRVDNDINNRRMIRHTEDGTIEDKTKANNKLSHGFAKNLVDEKIAYLLTKPYSLQCDNEEYINKVKDVLGKYFQYTLSNLGNEASNKGIAWLQVYVDEQGKFKTMLIPSEQCVPLWKDNTHTELDGMIRYYLITVYEGREKKQITKVEYYTAEGINYYVLRDKQLIRDVEVNEGGPILYYKKGDEWRTWGKVPFISFKNNRLEYPDIRFIKSLVDDYDKSRSDVSDFIEDVKNLIFVLKGYGGQDLSKFMQDLNYYRAIIIDDPEFGGVDTLNPSMDIEAAKEHFEQLKRDINEFGGGITKDLDKFGSSPSGVALRFLYEGLDLKCNHLEVEFKQAFEQLLYFANIYLAETGQGNFQNEDVDIIFNRDVAINESQTITDCQNSKGIISNKTIIANHPYVKGVEEEIKQIEKENKTDEPPMLNDNQAGEE